MTLREFTNHTYYITPLKIIDYNDSTLYAENVTPMTLDSINYSDIMSKKVMSWGMGLDSNNKKVMEIQIDY